MSRKLADPAADHHPPAVTPSGTATWQHGAMPRLLLAAPLVAALALSLAVSAPVASAAPKVTVQKKVKPGKRAAARLAGFPARARVTIQLQPTAYRDGNGFGIALKRRWRANAKGRGGIRFRMPRHYFACSSFDDCSRKRWRRGSRVDVNVCTLDPRTAACARAVARIR